jgi:hypothetical protein
MDAIPTMRDANAEPCLGKRISVHHKAKALCANRCICLNRMLSNLLWMAGNVEGELDLGSKSTRGQKKIIKIQNEVLSQTLV